MRKRIYFHIDEIARDAIVAANLKVVLEKRGIELVYGSRRLSRHISSICPFDALILPGLILLEPYLPDPTVPTPPIIVLPTEGIGGIPEHPQRAALKFIGAKFMRGDNRWAEKVAAYCLWGKQQQIGFEKYAPGLLPRCYVTGHPRFDRRCTSAPVRQPPSDRVRIGLLSRFALINPFDNRSNLTAAYDSRKTRYHHLQQEGSVLDIEDLYYTQISDLRIIYEFIDRLDPARHEVVLRIHPREDRGRWEELVANYKLPVKIARWDRPYIHWVQEVDWVVSPPSTSFYDSLYMRKPSICLNAIDARRKEHELRISDDTSKILQYAEQPENVDELLRMVSTKPAGPIKLPQDALDLLAHDANYPDCVQSLDALADVCERVIAEQPVQVRGADRIRFDAIAWIDQFRNRGGIDQSSSFKLDAARRKWIDSLACRDSSSTAAQLARA